MEILNRVGRSENVFILKKILYGDNWETVWPKLYSWQQNKKDSWKIVNRYIFLAHLSQRLIGELTV